LARHYRRKERPEALGNLELATATLVLRIRSGAVQPRPYPASYTKVASPGLAWIKEGRYWFAYRSSGDRVLIVAVFWDEADI